MIATLRRMERAARAGCFLAVLAGRLFCPVGRAMAAGGGPVLGGRYRSAQVVSVAFSDDGKRLASVSKGTPFYVWDTANGREVAEISGNGWKPLLWSLALSPHGRLLAAGAMPTLRHSLVPSASRLVHPASVTVWLLDTPSLHTRLEDFVPIGVHFPASIAFSTDGRYICAGEIFEGPEHHLVVWNVARARVVRGFSRWGNGVFAALFFPHGAVAGQPVGFRRKPVAFWDIRTGKIIRTYSGCDVVVMLALSPDARTLAGARGRNVCTWDVQSGHKRGSLRLNKGALASALAFSSNNSLVVAAARAGVSAWDVSKMSQTAGCKIPGLRVPAQFSPDGKLLAWGDEKAPVVHLWDVEACKEIRSFTMQRKGHSSVPAQAK